MTTLLLIRHALTDDVGVRISGRAPGVHLNRQGREQAEKLAVRLKDVGLQAIYCSPLERALETATPISAHCEVAFEIWGPLLEIEFGRWTGLTFQELKGERGGESMPQVQEWIVTALENLHAHHPESTIAVISHGDVLKAGIAHYIGISLDWIHRIEIEPASVSILRLGSEGPRLLRLNDCG